jgi:transposase-like protein
MTRANAALKIGERSEEWRERIAAQERSGVSVKQFCEERGVTEQSFYGWRKRLRRQAPLRFALVETGGTPRERATEADLELVLISGERLRIGGGVDPTALRKVPEALRA